MPSACDTPQVPTPGTLGGTLTHSPHPRLCYDPCVERVGSWVHGGFGAWSTAVLLKVERVPSTPKPPRPLGSQGKQDPQGEQASRAQPPQLQLPHLRSITLHSGSILAPAAQGRG